MVAKKKTLRPIIMEDVRLFSRNFEGKPTKFNPSGGVRRFCVILKPEHHERMLKEGWNVKYLKPRDEDEDSRPFVEVEVKFGKYPPEIHLINSKGKKSLNQRNCNLLDWAPPTNVDLVLNPYEYEVNGSEGVKAYLKSIYFTIYEDALDLKYANVPESSVDATISDYEADAEYEPETED